MRAVLVRIPAGDDRAEGDFDFGGEVMNWESATLKCMFCRQTVSGKLPMLDKSGWDWFRGKADERGACCPACLKIRRKDWYSFIEANGGYPIS